MKYLRWALVVVCVFLLIGVRQFERQLFYDPLLSFFKSDFNNAPFPQLNLWKHFLSITLRYAINSILSLAIIYLIFKNKDYLKLSIIIYLIFYVVFFGLYFYFIHSRFSLGYTAGFYVRRMIIQPILLLLLIPIFIYTQKQNQIEKTEDLK